MTMVVMGHAMSLQKMCLWYLAGNSQVTWLGGGAFPAVVWNNLLLATDKYSGSSGLVC
jgi:hypothetical protein